MREIKLLCFLYNEILWNVFNLFDNIFIFFLTFIRLIWTRSKSMLFKTGAFLARLTSFFFILQNIFLFSALFYPVFHFVLLYLALILTHTRPNIYTVHFFDLILLFICVFIFEFILSG